MPHALTVHRVGIDQPFPAQLTRGAVAVGNFDGVHRGHQSLVAALKAEAERVGGRAVVVTFDPHPLCLLDPARFMPVLTPPGDRAELLVANGANAVVLLQTTRELLQMSARDFLETLVFDRLKAQAVVEGFNFQFGKGREGDTRFLQEWCRVLGITCTIVPPFADDGHVVSSSRVRAALDVGDVAAAAKLLGRPYRLHGTVIGGERRGATLGFPTANLGDIPMHLPGDGVYAGRMGDHAAAINIGPNPTFGKIARKVEVHVLDFVGDLYGQRLYVDLVARVRDTKKFDSREQLIAQIREDSQRVRSLAFGEPPP